ncbi:hypothetical protein V6N11_056582 [Hibiscus sabdariffa]|uniref:RNase H type-1 domain-containing protein n=1 Tax=Hibiscus sabdariffa TaxID=183260 RepID=A0ABR2T4A6_9ROSI
MEDWWVNPTTILSSKRVSADFVGSWCPPISGCFKFNISRAYRDHKAGCSGILRNEEGTLRALFSGPIEGSCIDFAKLVSIKATLELFLEANWSGVAGLFCEVDSHSVLNWLNVPAQHLVSIDLLVKKISNVQFCYVNRSNNRLAEGLTKDGVSRATFFKAWW